MLLEPIATETIKEVLNTMGSPKIDAGALLVTVDVLTDEAVGEVEVTTIMSLPAV